MGVNHIPIPKNTNMRFLRKKDLNVQSPGFKNQFEEAVQKMLNDVVDNQENITLQDFPRPESKRIRKITKVYKTLLVEEKNETDDIRKNPSLVIRYMGEGTGMLISIGTNGRYSLKCPRGEDPNIQTSKHGSAISGTSDTSDNSDNKFTPLQSGSELGLHQELGNTKSSTYYHKLTGNLNDSYDVAGTEEDYSYCGYENHTKCPYPTDNNTGCYGNSSAGLEQDYSYNSYDSHPKWNYPVNYYYEGSVEATAETGQNYSYSGYVHD